MTNDNTINGTTTKHQHQQQLEREAKSKNVPKKCSDKKMAAKREPTSARFWRARASRPTLYRDLRC
jgi:hypothetical protein